MQTTSSTWKQLAAMEGVKVETKAIINNVEYTDEMSPPIISRALMQSGVTIGNVVSAVCTFSLDTTNTIPKSAEVQIKMRLTDGAETNPTTSEWLPCGTFYISKRKRDPISGQMGFECYDALLKGDAVLSELPWTDNNGNIITDANGEWICFAPSYPCRMDVLLEGLATLLGVEIDERTVIQTGSEYIISSLSGSATMRDALSIIAAANCGNFIITAENKLRLVPIIDAADAEEAEDDVIDVDAVVGSIFSENVGTITGVRHTVEGDTILVGNNNGVVVDVIPETQFATQIAQTLIGQQYQHYTAQTAFYDPAVELGDYVRYAGIVTSVLYSESVTLGPSCCGDISAPDPSEFTDEFPYIPNASKALVEAKEYAEEAAVEAAVEATNALNASLDQESIFNRLTDNGAVQGLILHDGKVYLNAEYIMAGRITSNLLLAALLTIGGTDNNDGQLKIRDANGNVIGTWDIDGISILKGSINGASLTLGGANNNSGTLVVKDANGNVIGTWDKNGVNILKGDINGISLTLGGANNNSGTLVVNDDDGNVIGTLNSDGFAINRGNITTFSDDNNSKVILDIGKLVFQTYRQNSGTGQYMYLNDLVISTDSGGKTSFSCSKSMNISADDDIVITNLLAPNITGGRIILSVSDNKVTISAGTGGSILLDDDVSVSGNLSVPAAASGTFTTADGKIVGVTDGIITYIL